MSVRRRSAHPQKTITAINRASLCRSERHSGFNPTQRALEGDFDSLAREGTRFAAVRNAVLREAALRYLRGPMPLAQVSAQLGFSEQSALTRSCKQWFGESPLAVRRRQREATQGR